MSYISVQDASKKWNLSPRRVQYFCANGKIENAKFVGNQWLIPDNAERPLDGRTKKAKASIELFPYHFPLFIHSRFFANTDELSEDEITLLSAQKLHLQGKSVKAIELCRSIGLLDSMPALSFGVYITIAYSSILLGLHSEYKFAVENAEKCLEKEQNHKEDLKLIYAGLIGHFGFNYKLLLEIDPDKLSNDALPYYQAMMALIYALSGKNVPVTAISSYEITTKGLDSMNIPSLSMIMRNSLALLYNRKGNLEKASNHTKILVDIAIKNGFDSYLAKCFVANSTGISNYLSKIDPKYLAKIVDLSSKNMTNWKLVTKLELGPLPGLNLSVEDTEIILLLSYGCSLERIATVKGVDANNIDNNLQAIMANFGVSSIESVASIAGDFFKIADFE